MRQKLTQKKLAALPEGTYQDADCPELWARVGKRGAVWFFRRTKNYKSIKKTIGPAAEIPREKALAICSGFSADLAAGKSPGGTDPRSGSQSRSKRGTFGELLAAYAADRISAGKKPAVHCGHLDALCDRPAASITRADLEAIRDALTAAGKPVMANRALSCARAVFNYGKRAGLFIGENPAALIRRNAETARRVYLPPEKISALKNALLRFLPDPARNRGASILLLCLLTWQRIGNVCRMRWEDLDLTNAVWHIPERSAKGRREINCPLVPEAIDLIAAQKSDPVPATFVFERNGKPATTPRKVWKSALSAAGLEDLHRHDLRHIMASMALRAGVPLVTVSDQLAHKDVSFTARTYAHVMVESKREALSAVTAAIERIPQKIPENIPENIPEK